MQEIKRKGRPAGRPRIKINAVYVSEGKSKHLFSVVTFAGVTEVMKAMQALQSRREMEAPAQEPFEDPG